MKNTKFSLLAIGAGALLVGCGLTAPLIPSSEVNQLPLSVALKEAYAEKAITGVSLLASSGLIETNPANPGPLFTQPLNAIELVTEEALVAKFTEYIALMDSFLTEDGQPFQVVELVSDREAYAFRLNITIQDLAGNTMTYDMYFNVKEEVIEEETSSENPSSEIATTSDGISSELLPSEDLPTSDISSSEIIVSSENVSSEVTSEPLTRRGDDEGEDEDEDTNETEEDEALEDEEERGEHENFDEDGLRDRSDEYAYEELHDRDFEEDDQVLLEGIVIFDGLEYQLLGVQEEDLDGMTTKFFIALDENNWIKIKRDIEVGEEKYDLSMMKDGAFSKLTFKTEVEDNGDIQIKLRTIVNGELISYSFKKQINEAGLEVIKIRVVEGFEILHVLAVPSIDDVTGETIYAFYVRESNRGYEGRPGHDGGRGH